MPPNLKKRQIVFQPDFGCCKYSKEGVNTKQNNLTEHLSRRTLRRWVKKSGNVSSKNYERLKCQYFTDFSFPLGESVLSD